MTLLPCPFCGGTPHPVEYHPIAHRVVCPSCDARGGKGASEAEAAEKWNRRASYAAHLPTDRTMRCPGWAAKETT